MKQHSERLRLLVNIKQQLKDKRQQPTPVNQTKITPKPVGSPTILRKR